MPRLAIAGASNLKRNHDIHSRTETRCAFVGSDSRSGEDTEGASRLFQSATVFA